jgi:exodeoxyribonuclease V alpha subunit
MTGATELDPFDVRRVRRADGLLGQFNAAGVLSAADVHVASRLAAIAGEHDNSVMLAVALAVRAPRLAHVQVDLATIRETAAVDADEQVDLSSLPWPDPGEWVDAVRRSGLVAVGESSAEARPLRLLGSALYLDRYWGQERQLALDLRAMGEADDPRVSVDLLADGLTRLFAGQTGTRQALAAASAVLRRFAVVGGGPGTGKTTTVARIVALLAEQAASAQSARPLVALAAPTGKAAVRLEEAVHEEALALDVSFEVRELLGGLKASTLHRLLGRRPGSYSRFRHDRGNHLPHDVVIVDETSMVSLSLMASLVDSLRPDARLVLVGDPGQLASIEAGAVLADIVGPAADRLTISEESCAQLQRVTGDRLFAAEPPEGAAVADGIVVLDRVHRFGEGIARLASAIRRGQVEDVLRVLRDPPDDVAWIPVEVTDPGAGADVLSPIQSLAVDAARSMIEAARAGAARNAIDALGAFRILCAHRRGPQGVVTWTARIEAWLEASLESFAGEDRWYVGRPLLVTENDYELRLYNGDTGVIVQSDAGRAVAAFDRSGEIVEFSPTRLESIETVYAMTIHKSQGSQFDVAAVLLPDIGSRILTRELLYTAATRARRKLILVGTEDMIRTAVQRPVARASGLRERLWGQV